MKRRNFLKWIIAGSTAAPLLSWSEIFANIKPLTKRRLKPQPPQPIAHGGIGISINGHRLGHVLEISGPTQSCEIDVTRLDSGDYVGSGPPNEGAIELVYCPTDGHEMELIADARKNTELVDMEISLTDGTALSFAAYVTQYVLDVGVDDGIKVTASLQVIGPVEIT
jgi:hypothetical protein